jgi:hypothetical protein
MRNSTRIVLALTIVSLMVGGGSVSATYAWYQLSADKSIEIDGTSFGRSTDLKIGFVSSAHLTSDSLTYDLSNSTLESKEIYWVDDVTVESELVEYVLTQNGYSDGDIYPITSGAFNEGQDSFTLYEPPLLNCTFSQYNAVASTNQYIHLSLAFMSSGGYSTSSTVNEGSEIYLSDFSIAGTAKNSSRVRLSSDTLGNILTSPTEDEDGYTLVGGPLDLNQDGEFDYRNDTKKEIFYGQRDLDVTYGTPYASSVETVDRNYDSFANPNHTAGVYPVDNVEATASKAYYESINNYIFTGLEENISALTETDEYGIAFLDMDIFLEGWDTDLINSVIGSTIGISMEFGIGE